MTYDEYNTFCFALPATTYVMQWGGAHVWKVGGKVFCIGGGSEDEPAYSFKAGEIGFMVLPEKPGFRPAPYLASRGLKWIEATSRIVDAKELRELILCSYRLVIAGLSKKKRREIGLEPMADSVKGNKHGAARRRD